MLQQSVLLAFIALFSLVHADLRMGARGPKHHLVKEDTLLKQNGTSSPAVSVYKIINSSYSKGYGATFTITELDVVDYGDNCASVVPTLGGPGKTFVVLHVTAPKNCKIHLKFDLYGEILTTCVSKN